MRRLRVLVLMHEDLVPPDSLEGLDSSRVLEVQTEWDVVTTLQKNVHDVMKLGIYDDLSKMRRAIEEYRPHIAFNLLEEFAGKALYDQNVVSYLQLLNVPFTGCGPRGLTLANDKAVSKKIMHFHRIPTPAFTVFARGRKARLPRRLEFPLLVKSTVADASLGISQASIVRDEKELTDRVDLIHRQLQTDALVESYIDGRELYVSILGNTRLEVFPIWEMVFENMPEGSAGIATRRAKWDPAYQKRRGITTAMAEGLDDDVVQRLGKLCRRVFRALYLRGYARIDIRLRTDGKPYVLEANPNPNIADYEDFAMSAHYGGVPYPRLLDRILSLGLRGHARDQF